MPRPTSTSVIVSGATPVEVLLGGAKMAAPATPMMIAATARCS